MWKKIFFFITALFVGIAIFTYVQIEKIQSTLVARLNANQIAVDNIAIDFFPTKITLTNLQYSKHPSHINIDTANIEISVLNLLAGNLAVKNIVLNNISHSYPSFPAVQYLTMIGKITQQNSNIFFDNVQLELQFAHPVYLDKRTFNFHIIEGFFNQNEMETPKFEGNIVINQQPVLIKAEIYQSKNEEKGLKILFKAWDCEQCAAEFEYNSTRDLSSLFTEGTLQFSSHNFPIEYWLKMADLDPLITGKADIVASGVVKNNRLQKLDMPITVKQGSLSGVNLLELASGILPINYDRENAPRDMAFEHLKLNANWENNLLYLEDIFILTENIIIEGKGISDLDQMQCDINLVMRPTNKKYQNVSLTVHFFDQCNRPQYQLKIRAKDYLKQLLKRKFSH